MPKDLRELLFFLRSRRRFNPDLYVEAKVKLLNEYFKRSGVQSCVVGISGGIDSAVTLALLDRAIKEPGSSIKKIVCALMPMFIREGTTGQVEATSRGREMITALGYEGSIIDLSKSHEELKTCVDLAVGIDGEAWASGQLVSNLRTPALYYITSLLTQSGFPGIVIGTTNRDEGGYIGYFGKAADGLVDLQVLSDIHKSEVYSLGRKFGLPSSILEAAPTGDIYDGRNDEDLIGVSYEVIELYSLFRCIENKEEAESLVASMDSASQIEWIRVIERLDTLNKQCGHKYLGGSPSVHLDVYPRAIPGGWRSELDHDDVFSYAHRVRTGQFIAEFDFKTDVLNLRTPCVPKVVLTGREFLNHYQC